MAEPVPFQTTIAAETLNFFNDVKMAFFSLAGLRVRPCEVQALRHANHTEIRWPTLPHEYSYTLYWCVKDKEYLNEQRCQDNVSSLSRNDLKTAGPLRFLKTSHVCSFRSVIKSIRRVL